MPSESFETLFFLFCPCSFLPFCFMGRYSDGTEESQKRIEQAAVASLTTARTTAKLGGTTRTSSRWTPSSATE
jgi:hypothetical protein